MDQDTSMGEGWSTHRPSVEELRSSVARADERTRALVSSRPFLSVALAVTAGYVLGRTFSRYM